MCRFRVKKNCFRVRICSFRVKKNCFRVKIYRFRVEKNCFRVKICRFRVKIYSFRHRILASQLLPLFFPLFWGQVGRFWQSRLPLHLAAGQREGAGGWVFWPSDAEGWGAKRRRLAHELGEAERSEPRSVATPRAARGRPRINLLIIWCANCELIMCELRMANGQCAAIFQQFCAL